MKTAPEQLYLIRATFLVVVIAIYSFILPDGFISIRNFQNAGGTVYCPKTKTLAVAVFEPQYSLGIHTVYGMDTLGPPGLLLTAPESSSSSSLSSKWICLLPSRDLPFFVPTNVTSRCRRRYRKKWTLEFLPTW